MYLSKYRKLSAVSVKELADHLGVTQAAVSQYENGKRRPDYETLIKIAEFLKCSTDELLFDHQSIDLNVFAAKFNHLDNDDRLIFDHLIDAFCHDKNSRVI